MIDLEKRIKDDFARVDLNLKSLMEESRNIDWEDEGSGLGERLEVVEEELEGGNWKTIPGRRVC